MIIATASISGRAMRRMPAIVARSQAPSNGRPRVWKKAVMTAPSSRHPSEGWGLVPQALPSEGGDASLRWHDGYINGYSSLRRLRKFFAVEQFRRAALHGGAGAADAVGEIEVLDRIGELAFRL